MLLPPVTFWQGIIPLVCVGRAPPPAKKPAAEDPSQDPLRNIVLSSIDTVQAGSGSVSSADNRRNIVITLITRPELYLSHARRSTFWTSQQPSDNCGVGRAFIHPYVGHVLASWLAAVVLDHSRSYIPPVHLLLCHSRYASLFPIPRSFATFFSAAFSST
jgi:hypothetical protein